MLGWAGRAGEGEDEDEGEGEGEGAGGRGVERKAPGDHVIARGRAAPVSGRDTGLRCGRKGHGLWAGGCPSVSIVCI